MMPSILDHILRCLEPAKTGPKRCGALGRWRTVEIFQTHSPALEPSVPFHSKTIPILVQTWYASFSLSTLQTHARVLPLFWYYTLSSDLHYIASSEDSSDPSVLTLLDQTWALAPVEAANWGRPWIDTTNIPNLCFRPARNVANARSGRASWQNWRAGCVRCRWEAVR